MEVPVVFPTSTSTSWRYPGEQDTHWISNGYTVSVRSLQNVYQGGEEFLRSLVSKENAF